MNCLCQIKLFCHAHVPVNNQYATTLSATTQFNLIKSDCTKGGVFLYRDRQYFHRGVLDFVSWVLLVTAAKQEPANQTKHSF